MNNKQSKPNAYLNSANVDRTTYNPHTSVTKQPPEKPIQQDKTIMKIMDVVGKL